MMNGDGSTWVVSSENDGSRLRRRRRRRRRCDELDVIPMDRALLSMLLPRFQSMFQYVVVNKPHILLQEDWILCGMHLLSYYFSIQSITPAMKVLQLKFNNIRNYRQIIGLVVSIVGPTLYYSILSRQSPFLTTSMIPTSTNHRINTTTTTTTAVLLARQRQQWVWNEMIQWTCRIISPLRLWNFLNFLKSSSSSSPPLSLAWRLSGLHYHPNGNPHPINFIYAYRRYMYEEALELAYAMLPISRMGILPSALVAFLTRIKTRIRNLVMNYTSNGGIIHFHNTNTTHDDNRNHLLRCSHCGESPISIPYQIDPCRHVYCYTCLRQAFIDNPNYKCKECGQSIQSSQRL